MSKKPSATALTPATVTAEIVPFAPETAPKAKGPKGGKITEVFVEQSYVDAFLNAEAGVKESAVNLFSACVAHRVSPNQFKGRSDAKVRASEFNCAHTAGKLLSPKGALKLISDAAARTGDKRANVLAALRRVKEVAPQLKGSALKGAALSKEIRAKADAAAEAASSADASKRAAAKAHRVARTPAPKANTVAAFVPLLMGALADGLEKMGKIDVPPTMLAKWRDLGDAMSAAVDACGALVAKS